jgi:hypothetical protein
VDDAAKSGKLIYARGSVPFSPPLFAAGKQPTAPSLLRAADIRTIRLCRFSRLSRPEQSPRRTRNEIANSPIGDGRSC